MADGNITVEVSTRATQAELERLRAALAELLACHTESAGWSMSMLTDRAEFDAMLARSQERLHAAIGAAREALGPNVRGEARLAAHQPSHTATATPQGIASTDQLGGRVRSEKD